MKHVMPPRRNHGTIYMIFIMMILLAFPKLRNALHNCNIDKLHEPHMSVNPRSFVIDREKKIFLKDGEPFQYISGSVHYFRIPVEYWQDRLTKMKAAGLDAIQVYVPWNFHEPEEGVYLFTDDRDLERFLELANATDLLVILRVGPYICAEWDYGGLPGWLLRKNPSMEIRSSAKDYLEAVRSWMSILLPKTRRFLYTYGGPIIMVQMENEYGSYPTCDQKYSTFLYDLAQCLLGPDVILFTTDGPSGEYLKCGSLDPRYLATIDFGPTAAPTDVAFGSVEQFRPNQPWVNSEFYIGWFDSWGGRHARSGAQFSATSLIRLMNNSTRVNVNMYMFHGGTNFELWAGKSATTSAATTSYDYDAPISEAGDLTPKYHIIRDAIFKFRGKEPPPLPANITRVAYGQIIMKRTGHILFGKTGGVEAITPRHMESFQQYQGFALYSTPLSVDQSDKTVTLQFTQLNDLAYIFTADKRRQSIKFHVKLASHQKKWTIQLPEGTTRETLLVLMENTGHTNYGGGMQQNAKGLIGPVKANDKVLGPWTMLGIRKPIGCTGCTDQIADPTEWPIVGSTYTGILTVNSEAERHDTYIHMESFNRGLLAVNSFILGRYNMPQGPQLRLYVPRQHLIVGSNKIEITELEDVHPVGDTNQLMITSVTDQAWLK